MVGWFLNCFLKGIKLANLKFSEIGDGRLFLVFGGRLVLGGRDYNGKSSKKVDDDFGVPTWLRKPPYGCSPLGVAWILNKSWSSEDDSWHSRNLQYPSRLWCLDDLRNFLNDTLMAQRLAKKDLSTRFYIRIADTLRILGSTWFFTLWDRRRDLKMGGSPKTLGVSILKWALDDLGYPHEIGTPPYVSPWWWVSRHCLTSRSSWIQPCWFIGFSSA